MQDLELVLDHHVVEEENNWIAFLLETGAPAVIEELEVDEIVDRTGRHLEDNRQCSGQL